MASSRRGIWKKIRNLDYEIAIVLSKHEMASEQESNLFIDRLCNDMAQDRTSWRLTCETGISFLNTTKPGL